MKYKIEGSAAGPLELAPSSVAQEVIQNIRIIQSTPKCTVPGYREFGMDMGYLHHPEQLAKTMYVVAINEAIKAFEPRAKLDGVTFGDSGGLFNPILEVSINE